MSSATPQPTPHRAALADLLSLQNHDLQSQGAPGLSPVLENIQRLREGANAVVTGQQVTLFGGPLFTLLKAATAIRRAKDASDAGHPHVPIFWLATEDHDLAEADSVALPAGDELRRLKLLVERRHGGPVGRIPLGEDVTRVLCEAASLLDPGPFFDELEACYRPGATFGNAFGSLLARVFSRYGLIVLDANSRDFHALGREVLRAAILRAEELHAALHDRDAQLSARNYHSQVLVPAQSSLLFLIEETGARVPLRRNAANRWQAGRNAYSTDDLLGILDREPERLSPNALLRPVFQDFILPSTAYVGGPSEIAYFAQSEVLYQKLLGRTTPILPRLSATLIEPAVASVMARHDLSLPDVIQAAMRDPQELAHRLGARALPIEAKRKLAATGNALEAELQALTGYLHSLSADLGRSSEVAASKMRYQMNRLRRLAANDQLRREQSLAHHALAVMLSLFPERHPQERIVGAAFFLSRYGDSLLETIVDHAGQLCPGHKAIWL